MTVDKFGRILKQMICAIACSMPVQGEDADRKDRQQEERRHWYPSRKQSPTKRDKIDEDDKQALVVVE